MPFVSATHTSVCVNNVIQSAALIQSVADILASCFGIVWLKEIATESYIAAVASMKQHSPNTLRSVFTSFITEKLAYLGNWCDVVDAIFLVQT